MNLFSEHVAKYACSCGCPEVELLEPSDMIVDRLNEMSRMLDEVRATASSEKSDAPVKTQSETIILKAAAPVLDVSNTISEKRPLSSVESELKAKLESMVDSRMA